MQLPAELRLAIDGACASSARRELAAAATALSEAYRKSERPPRAMSQRDALAYAATRMPATYAALRMVLREIAAAPESVLDIGAGTGAAAWAVRELWPEAGVSVHCVEPDAAMRALGQRLSPFAEWQESTETAASADVVVLSYLLGEVADPMAFAQAALKRAKRYLVILEPGTPRAFERINRLRTLAPVVAPCPHDGPCPMHAAKDWCHFAARVERSQLHRQLKGGELSHEDEKFSYLILSAAGQAERGLTAAGSRIVRHPRIEPGRIHLETCGADGLLHQIQVTKRDKEGFRAARKAQWGGVLTSR